MRAHSVDRIEDAANATGPGWAGWRSLHRWLPVDVFFHALAADLGNRAIGIVLSGTASDGTAGLKAIKAEEGIALVQDPQSAKFPGMPQSAIDAGVADATLTPADLAGARAARASSLFRRTAAARRRPEGRRDVEENLRRRAQRGRRRL